MSLYIGYGKSYSTTHYGANVAKYRCSQVHEEHDYSLDANHTIFRVFALQDVTGNGQRHAYPRGNTEEYAAMRAEFHKKYGPYSGTKIVKVLGGFQLSWFQASSILDREKKFFKQLSFLNAIVKTHTDSFLLTTEISENLMLTHYMKTYQFESDIAREEYQNPLIFPRQEKMRRAKALTFERIRKYRIMCENHLAAHPKLIYQLSPIVFAIFMGKRGTLQHTYYGVHLAKTGWLSREYGIIVSSRRIKWLSILNRFRSDETKRFVQLPPEIWKLVADFIVDVKVGEHFVDYFNRVFDRTTDSVKTEHAHMCKITEHRTLHVGEEHGESIVVELMQYRDL